MMAEPFWIAAVRCENCGYISAAEFSGGDERVMSYRRNFPVPCTLQLVREELHHPVCGGRLALSEDINDVDSLAKLDYHSE